MEWLPLLWIPASSAFSFGIVYGVCAIYNRGKRITAERQAQRNRYHYILGWNAAHDKIADQLRQVEGVTVIETTDAARTVH